MSLTAIVNLAERILNNSSNESSDPNSTSKPSKTVSPASTKSTGGDQFIPSAANQLDAGLFQVTKFSLFSAAAQSLLIQTNPPQTNSSAAATPVVPAVEEAASSSQVGVPATGAAPASFTTATNLSAAQNQLQALNNALAALGLNASELAQVDQIASLIYDFNPLAFTSLVYQLEALAQTGASRPAAVPSNALAPGTAKPNEDGSAAGNGPTTGGTINPSSSNSTSGFQLRELIIKFTGVRESQAPSGSEGNGGAIGFQFSALRLQIQEVNLTLVNQAGISVPVTAPQPAAVFAKTASA